MQLTGRQYLLEGGDRGPAIEPGDADASLLIQAIRHLPDADLKMPPSVRLSDADMQALERWVEMGAPWPEPNHPFAEGAETPFWAFQPLMRPAAPDVQNAAWPQSPIDRFVLAGLEAAGLEPAPPADKPALLRRVTFGLIGLPPTPEEIDAFLADDRPDAIARVVDRLLASPHYGERWARHWLDLVRFAETNGFEHDFDKPNAYRYRNYVIDSFNADLPYDQFVREHIAGDLLPTKRLSADGSTVISPVATGFLWFQEMLHMTVDYPAAQAAEIENQMDVLGKAFLGLTLSCARCHDHKFDPIGTDEYYSLAGILMSSTNVQQCIDSEQRAREIEHVHRRIADVEQRIQAILALLRTSSGLDALRQAEARKIKPYLLASRELLIAQEQADSEQTGEVARRWDVDAERLQEWLTALRKAGSRNDSVLGPWAQLAACPPGELAERIRERADDLDIEHAWINLLGPILMLPRDDVLLGDFEGDDFGDWKVEGQAFGTGPMRADGTRFGGHHGHALASSYASTDALTGRLTSPKFKVTSDTLAILLRVAGGDHPEKTCVNVIVNSQAMPQRLGFTVTGNHRHLLEPRLIGIGLFSGEDVFVEVVDDHQGPWGYIAVDDVRLVHDYHGQIELNRYYYERSLWREFADARIDSHEALADRYQELLLEALRGSDVPSALGERRPSERRVERSARRRAFRRSVALSNVRAWAIQDGSLLVSGEHAESLLSTDERVELSRLREEKKRLERALPTSAMGLVSADENVGDVCIQHRGDPHQPGDEVPRRFLRALCGSDPPLVRSGSGRLDLAEWLSPVNQPLAARVIVNRVWQHHFGQGLVTTPDNFGELGDRPVHPELLDYLARRFLDSGMSLKSLHRLLLLSSTYQQSGTASAKAMRLDPDNRLIHHMPLRRLDAECIRDAMLAVAGTLDCEMLGPSVPFPRDEGQMTTGHGRRSVYLEIRRNLPWPMLARFDFPRPDTCVGRRSTSVVPDQALTMLNNPTIHVQAAAWAARILQREASDRQHVQQMFLQAFGRDATEEELAAAFEFLSDQRQLYQRLSSDEHSHEQNAWADLCHVFFNVGEFIFIP